MLFTNRVNINFPSLLFGETLLSFTDIHKHLGVNFHSSGKWEVHVNDMINKCMKMIGILRKMKMSLSRKCLNSMYISFVRPVLEYASVVWDNCSMQDS